MNSQQEIHRQSRETAGPWDASLGDEERKWHSPLPSHLQATMREEIGRPIRATCGSQPGVTSRTFAFFDHGLFT